MSTDRGTLPPVGEEIDPELVGPDSHSNMSVDPEEPAPKRRPFGGFRHVPVEEATPMTEAPA